MFDRFDICEAYYYSPGANGVRFESLSENGQEIYLNLVAKWEESNGRIPSDMFDEEDNHENEQAYNAAACNF